MAHASTYPSAPPSAPRSGYPSDLSGILTRTPVFSEVRRAYGEHPSQFGELYLPPGRGPHPVVVMMHGGWWRSSVDLDTQSHACGALRDAGVACWNLEFRRVGDGGGWPATFEDVARATDLLRELATEYPLDLTRVVSAGFSSGAQLALWLAARHKLPKGSPLAGSANPLRLMGVVSLAGTLDLEVCSARRLSNGATVAFMGGTLDEVPERYAEACPVSLLPLGVPQILVHGDLDTSVPCAISERYAQFAKEAGDAIELIIAQCTGHYELIDPLSEAWLSVLDPLLRLLGLPGVENAAPMSEPAHSSVLVRTDRQLRKAAAGGR